MPDLHLLLAVIVVVGLLLASCIITVVVLYVAVAIMDYIQGTRGA